MFGIPQYHNIWQYNRVNFLTKKYGRDFFKDKTILELGSFNGAIGIYFSFFGAKVTVVEGNIQNYKQIPNYFNDVNIVCTNLDTPTWLFKKYDIIINFGLFYHLEKYFKEHLINCCKNCDLMFFESEVIHSIKDYIMINESKINLESNDQSLSNIGIKPNATYIEKLFNSHKFEYKRYDLKELNSETQIYDWTEYSKEYIRGMRRFWITSNGKYEI